MRRNRDEPPDRDELPEDPIEKIEVDHSLAGIAELTRGFYVSLISQGFTDAQAMQLTNTWLATMLQGQVSP